MTNIRIVVMSCLLAGCVAAQPTVIVEPVEPTNKIISERDREATRNAALAVYRSHTKQIQEIGSQRYAYEHEVLIAGFNDAAGDCRINIEVRGRSGIHREECRRYQRYAEDFDAVAAMLNLSNAYESVYLEQDNDIPGPYKFAAYTVMLDAYRTRQDSRLINELMK